ncbi:MAG: hypothetical protein J5821_04950 [Alphaproteobacteria bacterium]|nr:hypothetical protein [Alphaproteobacteria bacterium]
MEKLAIILNNEKVKGMIAIITAVVMYYTPDHIDKIIEMCLAALGISKLTLTKK